MLCEHELCGVGEKMKRKLETTSPDGTVHKYRSGHLARKQYVDRFAGVWSPLLPARLTHSPLPRGGERKKREAPQA